MAKNFIGDIREIVGATFGNEAGNDKREVRRENTFCYHFVSLSLSISLSLSLSRISSHTTFVTRIAINAHTLLSQRAQGPAFGDLFNRRAYLSKDILDVLERKGLAPEIPSPNPAENDGRCGCDMCTKFTAKKGMRALEEAKAALEGVKGKGKGKGKGKEKEKGKGKEKGKAKAKGAKEMAKGKGKRGNDHGIEEYDREKDVDAAPPHGHNGHSHDVSEDSFCADAELC